MRNTRGVLIHIAPVAVSVSRVVHAPRVHLRPNGAGRLLPHSPEIDGAAQVSDSGEMSVEPSAVDRVLERPMRFSRGPSRDRGRRAGR